MSEPKLRLFTVECRGCQGVTTFFMPAQSADEAIIQAMTSANEAQAQHPNVANPFQEANFEVRVGTFEAPGAPEIIFGEWSRLSN